MNFAQCVQDFSMQNGLVISLFLGGLAGGFTHCSAMCGPFVLAQSDAGHDTPEPTLARLSRVALLPYHLGRMTTYVFMAVLFQSVLNLALLYSSYKAVLTAPILMLAGVLFLVSVFPALSRVFPWASALHLGLPFGFIGKHSAAFTAEPGLFKRYMLGIMLGFMPCGMVVAALMAASTAPTILQAALAMGAFALGTMPALILVALGGRSLQSRFPKAAGTIKQGAMAFSALWLFALAGWMMI